MPEPVLCYINGSWAYFTTQPLDQQWGDDWNDAPYEHNAGGPYAFSEYDAKKGREPWEIVTVHFSPGDLVDPSYGTVNSRFSVEDINKKGFPWLRPGEWWERNGEATEPIFAGATIPEFKRLVRKAGGIIWKEDEE